MIVEVEEEGEESAAGGPGLTPQASAVAEPPSDPREARLRESEARVRDLTAALRRSEGELEQARRKAEQAEKARQKGGDEGRQDRQQLEREISQRHQADLHAAKKTIDQLQAKLDAVSVAESEDAGSSAVGAEGAGDVDAVISGLKRSRFGRRVRMSVLVHGLVIGLLILAGALFSGSDKGAAKNGKSGGTNAVPAAAQGPAPERRAQPAVPAAAAEAPRKEPAPAPPATPEPAATEPAEPPRQVSLPTNGPLPEKHEVPQASEVKLDLER